MQHKAVLRFAEHLQPHYHGHYGADATDKEHIYVQRDAPHHRAAEARDIPVHGIQLDDLLHIEAADGKGHLDVVVDLRKNSATFGKHVAVVLSGENKRQFFIPKGFAHGFAVLSPQAVFQYKCDNYYAPQYESGIQFDDPALGIDWKIPEAEMILSAKDRMHKRLSEAFVFEG